MIETRVMIRTGGRTEANRQAVAAAVLRMVAGGNLLFDVQEVADQSGVHRTTVRRRWPTREALLAEAMAEHTSRLTVDLTGDWRLVLKRIALALRDFMNDPVEDALNRLVAISANDAFTRLVRRHWRGVLSDLAAPLVAAQNAGHISPHADVATTLSMLSSTILTFVVYARRPIDDARLEQMVAQLIRGLEAERP
jgi:AcrR family transcriptional regulator